MVLTVGFSVSLARAVYSRASVLFLDDVLSAVDAHTAHHLYHKCLKGDLMKGRTVILVSHHVQVCAPGASYIVALDNGRVIFEGGRDVFQSSGIIRSLGQTSTTHDDGEEKEKLIEIEDEVLGGHSEGESTTAAEASTSGSVIDAKKPKEKKPARKLVEEETRAVGRIGRDIWATFFWAYGHRWYWSIFGLIFAIASLAPVFENGWLKYGSAFNSLQNTTDHTSHRYWSAAALNGAGESPEFYISIYAGITGVGVVLTTLRWFVLYDGSIRASTALYKRLLESVLFANIRFHDTVSRGRLLNRFGNDFEGIDSGLSDDFGGMITCALSALATIVAVSFVGGWPFLVIIIVLAWIYYQGECPRYSA